MGGTSRLEEGDGSWLALGWGERETSRWTRFATCRI